MPSSRRFSRGSRLIGCRLVAEAFDVAVHRAGDARQDAVADAECGLVRDCRPARSPARTRGRSPSAFPDRRLGDQIAVGVAPDRCRARPPAAGARSSAAPCRLPDNAPSSVISASSLFRAIAGAALDVEGTRDFALAHLLRALADESRGRLLSTASGRHRRPPPPCRVRPPSFRSWEICGPRCAPTLSPRGLFPGSIDQARPALVQRGVPAKGCRGDKEIWSVRIGVSLCLRSLGLFRRRLLRSVALGLGGRFLCRRLLRGSFLAFLPPPLAARSASSATAWSTVTAVGSLPLGTLA